MMNKYTQVALIAAERIKTVCRREPPGRKQVVKFSRKEAIPRQKAAPKMHFLDYMTQLQTPKMLHTPERPLLAQSPFRL